MTATVMNRGDDLARLREHWYSEGYYSSQTLAAAIERAGRDFGDTRFVFASETDRQITTFPQMVRAARRVAAGLQRLGIQSGDVVAVQVPNRRELVEAYFGTWFAGATLVPIVHIYGSNELRDIVIDARAKALIVPDAWRSIDFLDRVADLGSVESLEHVVVIGEAAGSDAIRWSDLVAGPAEPEPVMGVHADDVAAIIYTSGTTGRPKGVQHSHNSFLAELRKGDAMNEVTTGDSRLIPWPAGHIAGLLAVCGGITGGVEAVLMDRWNEKLAVELIEEFGCTITSGTPLHVDAILREAQATGRDVSSLRFVHVGGTNVPPVLVEKADARGVVIGRAYGSTEQPRCATSPEAASAAKRSLTDGQVRFGDEIRIVDEELRDLPSGSEGEIVTRGPSQFIGYRDQSADEAAFLPGSWFRTGDVGRLDDEGYLTVTDRIKDIIIRGGENIASKEVEDILATHPRVQHAAVVAAPDPKYGERVAAFVILTDGGGLDVDEVRDFFVDRGVAPQKAPEWIEVVGDLPRAPSGKVRKFELRDQLRTERQASQDG